MKHIWKIALLVAIIAIFQATYSGPLGVDKIDVMNANTLKVTLSENPNLKVGENEADITILNDIKIQAAVAKEGKVNEIEILIEDAMLPNTNYSLLTVSGAQGSIDFTTPTAVEGYTQKNTIVAEEQEIESIELIDEKTILVKYKQTLTSSAYEFKLLAETAVDKIEKLSYDIPELLITVEPPLRAEQDYILMIIDMKDVDGTQLEFDTGIYDFKTPLFPEIIKEEKTTDPLIELNAAGEDTSLEKETLLEDTSLAGSGTTTEIVAATLTQTPATGTATWLLIFTTIFINGFYFFTRRKKV